MSYSNGPKSITNGLVLYLDAANPKSYISGSNTWIDIVSGGATTGSLVNGATYNSDAKGNIVFDGSNDRIVVSRNSTIEPTNVTFCFWLKRTATKNHQIIRKQGPDGNGFDIRTENDTLFWWVRTSVWDNVTTNITNSIPLNTWKFLSTTYDGTTLKIYINGVFITQKNHSNSGNITHDSTDLFFGGSIHDGSYVLQGNISCITMYNRALSSQEILQNYNSTKGRFGL